MEDWAKLKVVDLKAELKRRDLSVNGLKAELVDRLQTDDVARANDEPAEEEAENNTEDAEVRGEDGVAAAPIDPVPQGEVKETALPAANESAPQATNDNDVAQDKGEAKLLKDTEASSHSNLNTASPDLMQTDESSAVDHDSKPHATATAPVAHAPEHIDTTTVARETLPSPDSQKRKRRSQSPPPVEEEVARKRARADSDAGPKNGVVIDTGMELMPDAPPLQSPREASRSRGPPIPEPSQTLSPERRDHDMDMERDVPPALHPATSALYINNLMRPLRPADLRAHLASLASSNASPDEVITTFFLDQIRTHALVVFDSTTSAARVRTALHDRIWPEESNRKALSVDFVPPEKVEEWIETEEGAGRGGRAGSRWEVVYEILPDETVEVHLRSGAVSSARPGPLPSGRGPALQPGPNLYDGPNAIPLGPRGFRDDHNPPPTGPRSSREQFQRERPPPAPGSLTTRSHPYISYQPVSSSLAKRRIDNMQAHYTRDPRRNLGREINRYYFEDGDKFVDRGKEVFEGIRPPHKERGGGFRGRGGGGRRGGGGGGGGARGRGRGRAGDRYMPSGRGRLAEDEGRLPRYIDDR